VWAGARAPGIPGGQSDCRLLRGGVRVRLWDRPPLPAGRWLRSISVRPKSAAVEESQRLGHRNPDTPTAADLGRRSHKNAAFSAPGVFGVPSTSEAC
jgi:hypothetical protein